MEENRILSEKDKITPSSSYKPFPGTSLLSSASFPVQASIHEFSVAFSGRFLSKKIWKIS
jgi:hypothetical protein